jgi:hypothetical protein
MLRFAEEDRVTEGERSGYGFVSREGDGVWRLRRPVLLVVEAANGPQTRQAAATVPSR